MNKVYNFGENRVDSLSQKILIALADQDQPLSNAELAREFGVNRGKTHTRLNKHLIPADFVQKEQGDRIGDGPYYSLTTSGTMWVEDKRDELERPTTLDEVSERVLEAQRESESAKNSVQNYRKKLYQVKQENEKIEEKLDEIRSKGAGGVSHEDMVDFVDFRSTQVQRDIDARDSRLDARVDALSEDLETLGENIIHVHKQTQENSEGIDGVAEEMNKARNSFFAVQERVDEVESEIEDIRVDEDSGGSGWWPR
ncbi:helix-turn-helix domain-containing protein [Natrinema salsiterrestre]|uniref:Helix-turn-helix domain-containing protein n=1 Tax=Natrinema salsiterrestre TaxID=2950540 RepID=A0A9Q4Q581_9EURY|nr:helix-turn-helix domain-containing protein [Natrinema salsiterrestre]MDF9748307.1 helix-turn-helix domain-containing protein [Natrinema salsiterrestre]